jgi:hypothetical protein
LKRTLRAHPNDPMAHGHVSRKTTCYFAREKFWTCTDRTVQIRREDFALL